MVDSRAKLPSKIKQHCSGGATHAAYNLYRHVLISIPADVIKYSDRNNLKGRVFVLFGGL